ncbi:hypothetical protein [Brevibacillus massiliensis]|jgi:hypothetical protein|uniref:hypothetical protein n=1 Tax=Brevibacillus massiliensis TaxID=1118054 RepID=UPI0003073B15|nr:hypothetical protein [Brevibacillus massiliensis]
MYVVIFIIEALIPLGILIYTINFGRWLGKRKLPVGAFGAYFVGGLSFALTIWMLLRGFS